MTRRRRPAVALGDDDARRTFFGRSAVGGGLLVMRRRLRVNREDDVRRQRSPRLDALPLPHFLQRLLLKLSGLFFDRQLGLQTRASHEV